MRRAVPLLLAAVLLVAGFAELDEYGVTWDEALGDFFFGDRYASIFFGEPDPASRVPGLSMSPLRDRPHEHWPVASTLAAATSRMLSRWLDPFDGFHALNLFLGALLVIVFYRFVERSASTAAAIVATLLLFLMPRIVADLMANIKDFPEMVFFSLTLIAFYAAFEKGSAIGIAASGLLWGLALGTKANALFVPVIIVAFLLVRGLPDAWRGRKVALLLSLASAAIAGIALLIASWPWLWDAPFERLLLNVRYTLARGRGFNAANVAPWYLMVLLTTPIAVLILAGASVPGLIRRARAREPLALFLLSWIAVVAVRLSIPGAVNFDGVRHFLELFPPLAALAGIGAVEWAQRLQAPRAVRTAILAVPIACTAWSLIAVHPFETVYWNALIGGYSGARALRIPQSSDYWVASYRHGMRWMNGHAERNAMLIVPIAGHTVTMAAPVRLRRDIRVVVPRRISAEDAMRWPAVAAELAKTRPVYLMFVPREDWRTPLDVDAEQRLTPAARWQRDGAPVLLIYRLSKNAIAAPAR
jgi:hypothetical protein